MAFYRVSQQRLWARVPRAGPFEIDLCIFEQSGQEVFHSSVFARRLKCGLLFPSRPAQIELIQCVYGAGMFAWVIGHLTPRQNEYLFGSLDQSHAICRTINALQHPLPTISKLQSLELEALRMQIHVYHSTTLDRVIFIEFFSIYIITWNSIEAMHIQWQRIRLLWWNIERCVKPLGKLPLRFNLSISLKAPGFHGAMLKAFCLPGN